MRNRGLKCLILIVLMINLTYSQQLVPPIQNFSPIVYKAASQNWDIAVDNRGIIYAANNEGLLVFDGLSWELLSLESESIIRSVHVKGDKVFTGSYKEFGYWEKDDNGIWSYTSLSTLMEEFEMQSDEFWDIFEFNDAIYFRSFGGVFKYDGDTTKKYNKVEDSRAE